MIPQFSVHVVRICPLMPNSSQHLQILIEINVLILPRGAVMTQLLLSVLVAYFDTLIVIQFYLYLTHCLVLPDVTARSACNFPGHVFFFATITFLNYVFSFLRFDLFPS